MNVKHILESKGRGVVTIEPSQTLADAAQLLANRRIGAAVVSDVFRPVLGILSERDIVRAVAARGPAALHEPVVTAMTEEVVTCTEQSTTHELMGLMTDGRFRHVPVIEGGRLVGIVSIGDLVKHRLAEMEEESRAMRDYIATA